MTSRRPMLALVAFLGAAVLAYVAVNPAPRVVRVAWLNAGPAAPNAPNVAAFRGRLRDLGYVEGGNLIIDFRWGDQQVERLPSLAADLLALKPDVFIATGGAPTALAVKAATRSVPVVFITGDPVAEGIVSDLARPDGNLTGFAVLGFSLDAKRLEILREVLPQLTGVAFIWNPVTKNALLGKRAAEAAAARLGLQVEWREARNGAELDAALASLPIERVEGLVVQADAVLGFERRRIVEFANRNRIPGVYFWREFVLDGGFCSYGPSLTATFRSAAEYADAIIKGAKPGDLPVQEPTTFELVLNRTTAIALGIQIPQAMLVRATDVVE